MKILHILGTDRLSGAENVHLDILRSLKDDNEVIYASPDGPIRRSVEEAGVTFLPCNTESVKEIKRLYRELAPDAVHACDPRMSFKCARAGIPFVAHLHNNCPWMKKYSANSFALRYAAKKASAVIVVSNSVSNDYVFSSVFRDKLHIIPNVVDRMKVEKMAEEPFEKQFDILFVGRFTDQKRPILFLKFVKDLTLRLPSIKAAMVGEGELFFDAEKYIGENSIHNVSLIGFDPNPYRIIKKSKLIIFTSYYEGFGLVAVEGMILGKPVLAYPSGGITEIARRGGVLCRTHEEMVEAAYNLLRDSDEYIKASNKAYEASFEYTNTGTYMDKIKKIYADLVIGK